MSIGLWLSLSICEIISCLVCLCVEIDGIARNEFMFQLTLDPPTADWLRAYYRDLSGVILEYGSGGSSVLALRANSSNQLYSCETDSLWLARLSSFLTENGLSERFHPLHCDVGPTKQWGYPDFNQADFSHDRGTQFLLAAWKPWNMLRTLKINPDFVLIDGRWRVPSFLAAVVNCQAPVKILFDDYLERKHYHVVESIQAPTQMIGRAALFEVEPRERGAQEFLANYLHLFFKPD
jgi:hypothetical protein